MIQHSSTSALVTQNHLTLAIQRLNEHAHPFLVDAELRRNLVAANERLRQARLNHKNAQDTIAARTEARRRDGFAMVKTIRDFYNVLKRTASREQNATSWLTLYQSKSALPRKASLNHPWFELGRGIAEAETMVKTLLAQNALAFTTPPPANPSAEDVKARLELAEQADQGWRNAVMALKEPAAALRAARKNGLLQLKALRLTLRAKMVDWPDEERRKMLRMFGFDFVPSKKESTALADAPKRDPSPPHRQERASA